MQVTWPQNSRDVQRPIRPNAGIRESTEKIKKKSTRSLGDLRSAPDNSDADCSVPGTVGQPHMHNFMLEHF
jgi:hypothetical protein